MRIQHSFAILLAGWMTGTQAVKAFPAAKAPAGKAPDVPGKPWANKLF